MKYKFLLIFCNIIITGPIDHGLHVILLHNLTLPGLHMTYQLYLSIYTASTMNFSLHHCIIVITLSLLYQLGHQSTLALSGSEVLRVVDYLQTNIFPDLVMVEQKEYSHALQKKTIREVMSKVVREIAGRT